MKKRREKFTISGMVITTIRLEIAVRVIDNAVSPFENVTDKIGSRSAGTSCQNHNSNGKFGCTHGN
jgi:hypothetical protein